MGHRQSHGDRPTEVPDKIQYHYIFFRGSREIGSIAYNLYVLLPIYDQEDTETQKALRYENGKPRC